MCLLMWLYNLLLIVASPVWLVLLIWRMAVRGKGRRGLRERLGGWPAAKHGERWIWVHAVSVGEVMAAQPVLHALKALMPEHRLLLSVLTDGGYATASALVGKSIDRVAYLPYDLFWLTDRAVRALRPECLVVMETELWPNLFDSCRRHGVPVLIANARLSDRSFPVYRRWIRLLRPIWRCVTQILAQSPTDAERFRAIGASPEQVTCAGNTKFDQAPVAEDCTPLEMRTRLGLCPDGPLVVIGSTRAEAEENLVAEALSLLRADHPDLVVVWAPRHLERTDCVCQALRRYGFDPRRRTAGLPDAPDRTLVLDTYGELAASYVAADVAVIGGSFVPLGGQNLLQPLAVGVPVVHGPYMHNFRDVTELAHRAEVAFPASNTAELVDQLRILLDAPDLRATLRTRAIELVRANAGAAQRVAEAAVAAIGAR